MKVIDEKTLRLNVSLPLTRRQYSNDFKYVVDSALVIFFGEGELDVTLDGSSYIINGMKCCQCGERIRFTGLALVVDGGFDFKLKCDCLASGWLQLRRIPC